MDMLMGACSYFVVKSVIFITAHCILKAVHVFFFFKEFLKKNIKSLIKLHEMWYLKVKKEMTAYIKKKLQAAWLNTHFFMGPMIKEPIKILIGQLYSMNNKDISIYKRVFLATASFPKNNKFTCLIWHMPFLMWSSYMSGFGTSIRTQ